MGNNTPPGLPPGIKAFFMGSSHGPGCTCNDRNPTVAAHYGVKDNSAAHMEREMFIDLIRKSELTDVLDKNFADLSQEQRLKVFMFAEAYMQWRSKKIELISEDEDLEEEEDENEEEDDRDEDMQ